MIISDTLCKLPGHKLPCKLTRTPQVVSLRKVHRAPIRDITLIARVIEMAKYVRGVAVCLFVFVLFWGGLYVCVCTI